ncbi:MAG: M23 family metallopeptidase [Chloroflexi bacterium]|nr:MAG: M23 family metallopeptidase [Chloroflexota bacterium]
MVLVRPALFAFWLLTVLAAVAACGGSDAAAPSLTTAPATGTATPPPTATPAPTPEPTPAPTPTPPPSLDFSASQPRQGGFLFARLLYPPPGLADVTIDFNGVSHPMLPAADRWFAVIGLDIYLGVGDYPISAKSGDTVLAAGTLSVSDGGFQYESIELPPSSIDLLTDQNAVNNERATLAQVFSRFTPERRWSGAWILPAPGAFTDGFGLMRSINGAPYYPHTGTDIANEKGTPVAAAATGVVALARPMYLYGNVVIIDHGAGVFSGYNHLDSIAVTEGQAVTIGDLVGFMGETGFVSGPHLHWEAIIGGVRVDALLFTQQPLDP